jgi:tetratricopeptide (TPR) repeat protein
MIKFVRLISVIISILFAVNFSYAENNFYNQALKEFNKKDYDQAKFLFERNIVFNPKDANSYLYLAKIFKEKENKREEEKNLNTTLLLDPSNEDATLRLMDIAIEKSNYSEVKELSEKFVKICKDLCKENNRILESLKDLEPKNDT